MTYTRVVKFMILPILFIIPTISEALNIPYETISYWQTGGSENQYGWEVSYDIGYWNDEIQIGIDIKVDGILNNNWMMADDLWSKPGYNFSFNWVDYDYNYRVYSSPEVQYQNLYQWNSNSNYRMVAHEAGHMFGLYDEYFGGAVNPDEPYYDPLGIMGNMQGTTFDRYYQSFDNWLSEKQGVKHSTPNVSATPEPFTFILLLFGGGITILCRKYLKN